jgi:hypothetical protein
MDPSTKEQIPPQGKELDVHDNTSSDTFKDSPSETIDEDEDQFMSGAKLHVLILGLCLACFLMALDMSIITVAIPKITEKFHSTADIGWYVSAYLLTLCSLQPLSGKLYSNFSLKVGPQDDDSAVRIDLTVPSGLSWRFFFSSRSDRPFLVLLPHRICSLLAGRSQA